MENCVNIQKTHYRNGRIFTADEPRWAASLIVDGDKLAYVGDTPTADALADGAEIVDLAGAFVVPGFIDAHTHLLMMGLSRQKVDLTGARHLREIQSRIREAAELNPEAPRILGRSWLVTALDGRAPTRQMLDEVEPERPVYVESYDGHSVWVNTAALGELGIDEHTPDPMGGQIVRDRATGVATGMLHETAVSEFVWPMLSSNVSDADADAALAAAFGNYLADGVTGAIDMGLGAEDVAAIKRASDKGGGTLPLRVAGHWRIIRNASEAENLRQVQEAVELSRQFQGDWFSIVGIKLIIDGVIDSCTAAMKDPYADGSHSDPMWDLESLVPVVVAADAAGLQIAMHAIGDEASSIALNALEQAVAVNGDRSRRHRMEHVETITKSDVQRLARLGVIASMQPVHADPALQDNWRAMLGDHRVERAYPWSELTAAGAVLAFGTDAPTAPHSPLPNMFIAATRKSATDPTCEPNLPEYALPLADALAHGTRDAAFSCRWEELTGQLVKGKAADFVVLDSDPFTAGNTSLLTTRVRLTVVAGAVRYQQTGAPPAGVR
ncbi:amidohydrolase [Nocardia sp. CWNU-33]|uniref:amidohydrolase n=1 Tax=Nocardia sp. CWNU-33 TaxID=3392117 RepID=UPI00398F8BCA